MGLIRYYSASFATGKDQSAIKKSIESLVIKPRDGSFIFPFCLFQKEYYDHLKNVNRSPYEGNTTVNGFELYRAIRYGTGNLGHTSREVVISGRIIDGANHCTVKMDFKTSSFLTYFYMTFFAVLIILYCLLNNPMFILILAVFVLEEIRIVTTNYWKIRNRVNWTKVAR